MNIRGLLGPNIPTTPVRSVDKVDRAIKSDMTHDRDANGQQTFDDQKKHQEPMSEEQLQKSLETLKNLPGVKEHKWTIELEIENGAKFVLIKDNLGAVIRKIPELELWSLPMDNDMQKGNLFHKAA